MDYLGLSLKHHFQYVEGHPHPQSKWFVCHKGRSLYVIKVGVLRQALCESLFILQKGKGFFQPYKPPFYGLFLGHTFS